MNENEIGKSIVDAALQCIGNLDQDCLKVFTKSSSLTSLRNVDYQSTAKYPYR